jgi:hypothetical protein
MVTVRRSAVAIFFICLVAVSSAFGSATNIYITQSGSPSGNCTTNVQTPAFFNNAANWGSGASQIGPGTTVLLCGTFTFASGGNGLTVQGSGTNGNPITINFDTGAILQAPYFGGNGNNSCSGQPCGGAISIYNENYITVNGQNTGIIQNTANGSSLANQAPSVGLYASGDHILIKNLTIENIYLNTSAESSATPGFNSADLLIDNGSTNVEVCENYLNNAHMGITGNAAGPTSYIAGPTNACADTQAATGLNFYSNTLVDHAWHLQMAATNYANYYNNDLSGWSNWFYPTGGSAYHTDGIFVDSVTTTIQIAYIYNNYVHGDFVGGSPTGFLHCSVQGANSSGHGSSCHAFNNVFIGMGGTANQGSAVWGHAGSIGPHYFYNNTIVGFCCSITQEGDNTIQFTFENNIFVPGTGGAGPFFYYQTSPPGAPISHFTGAGNDYYTTGTPNWNLGDPGQSFNALSSWKSALSGGGSPNADTGSVNNNPSLTGSYTLNSGSAAVGIGENLTSLGIAALDIGAPQTFGVGGSCGTGCLPRPASGAWDAGAYPRSSNNASAPPAPPQGLTATVR